MRNESITRPEVCKLARLARLRLRGEEVDRMARELDAIVEYMSVLSETDVAPPDTPSEERAHRLREDEPRPGLDRDVALEQSAHANADGFLVPSIKET